MQRNLMLITVIGMKTEPFVIFVGYILLIHIIYSFFRLIAITMNH
jgi:predicted tellurium resistance membrane protein TerC